MRSNENSQKANLRHTISKVCRLELPIGLKNGYGVVYTNRDSQRAYAMEMSEAQ